jgi:undecaprenyl-diphosphatase
MRFMTVSPQSMLEFIAARDHRLMRRVHNWRAPKWVRMWMILATRGGDGWLWYLTVLLVLLFGGRHRFAAATAAGVAASIGIAIFFVVKRHTGRKRPCALEPHCWAQLLPPDQFSFPSGHSITAFAMAISIGLFYPPLMPALLFCALSIAVSRIILGMHFLSDVIVGSGIGATIGYLSYLIYS